MGSLSSDTGDVDVVVDLRSTEGVYEPDVDTVLAWLRTSGGTLHDRLIKQAAADLIDASRAPR